MKKKGFTLIEILAVIVILAVIALITVPIVMSVIEKSRKAAFRDSVLSAFHQVDYYLVENNRGEMPEEGLEVTEIGLGKSQFQYGRFYQREELEVVNISDGKYCAIGTMENLRIFKGECDFTTPRCSLKIEGEEGVGMWYNKNPKVLMETSEALTGGLKYGIGKEENYSNEVEDGKVGKVEYQTTEETSTRVYCYVKNIGEKKGTNSIEVKIDKTSPEEADFSYITTSKSIRVIASGKDKESGIVRYQFSKDNGTTWTSIQEKNSYTFDNLTYQEYQIKVRVYNGTYVEKNKEKNLYKESETKVVKPEELGVPTYEVSPTTWTSGNVKVTIKYPSEGGKLFKTTIHTTSNKNVVKCSNVYNGTYTCGGETTREIEAGTWYQVGEDVELTYSENGSVIAQVADGVNYKSGSSLTISNIDKTGPSASIATSAIKTDRTKVSATCRDAESGIIKYEYSKDNGATWIDGKTTGSYTFTGLTKGTKYNYKVRCTNGSGLTKEASKSATTSSMTNPTIAQVSQLPATGYTWATERVIQITYDNTNIQSPVYYFKSSVEATVESGVILGICGTGTNPGTCTSSSVTTLAANTWYSTTSATPSITYKSNGTLYAVVSDRTNLSGTATFTVSQVSTGTPTAPVITGGSNDWSSSNRTISVRTASTETSGILKYQYYVSTSNSEQAGGSWRDCSTSATSQTITTAGIRYIYFRAVANNGNISAVSKSNTTKIDKTNPTVSVEVNKKVATLKLQDNMGLVGYAVTSATATPSNWTSISGTEASPTWEASSAGTYYAHVKDVAGRTAYVSFEMAQTSFSYEAIPKTETYVTTNTQEQCSGSAPCCPSASGCPQSCAINSCSASCRCNCNGTTCYPTATCKTGCTTVYVCNSGYSLVPGTSTCTRTIYTCPEGGTLNNTTKMCEL